MEGNSFLLLEMHSWALMEVVAGEASVCFGPALGRVAEIIFTSCSCRAGHLIARKTDPEYITMHPWCVINGLVEFSSTAKPSHDNIRKSSRPQFPTTWATKIMKITIFNDVKFLQFYAVKHQLMYFSIQYRMTVSTNLWKGRMTLMGSVMCASENVTYRWCWFASFGSADQSEVLGLVAAKRCRCVLCYHRDVVRRCCRGEKDISINTQAKNYQQERAHHST